jgi:hypothetical protein
MTDLLTKQDLQAFRPDLQAEFESLRTAIDGFEARLGIKIDAQTRRLTIRLASILIAGLIGMWFVLFA